MKLKETIRLCGKPLLDPLPIDAKILVEYFAKCGFAFEVISERVIILHENYDPKRIVVIKKAIEKMNLDLTINHSIGTKYTKKDFENNPLWYLLFPEIFIDGIDFYKV